MVATPALSMVTSPLMVTPVATSEALPTSIFALVREFVKPSVQLQLDPGFKSVPARQADVHENEVGEFDSCQLYALLSRRCLDDKVT